MLSKTHKQGCKSREPGHKHACTYHHSFTRAITLVAARFTVDPDPSSRLYLSPLSSALSRPAPTALSSNCFSLILSDQVANVHPFSDAVSQALLSARILFTAYKTHTDSSHTKSTRQVMFSYLCVCEVFSWPDFTSLWTATALSLSLGPVWLGH